MQQLLQMMQKITAEPNNNARVQASSPSSQIIPTDEGQTDEGQTDEGQTDEGQTDESQTDESQTDESTETGFDVILEDGSAGHREINTEAGAESNSKFNSAVVVSPEVDAETSFVDSSDSDSESSAELSVEADAEASLVASSDNNSESDLIANPDADSDNRVDHSAAQVTSDSAYLASEQQLSGNNDIVESPADDFSENDIVIDEPITPTAPQKAGFIKRWVNKAVSWVKRLVGF